MKFKYFTLLLLLSNFSFVQIQTVDADEIQKRISNMTLQEKIGQLNQIDGSGNLDDLKELIRKGMVGSVMNIADPQVVNDLQKTACEQASAKIPLVFARDVVHGFKTILPIPLAQAATFDPDLIKEGARIAATEATEHGVKWAFAPMIDISRDARWGRIAESFGEDTYLTQKMAVAVVEGYQGNSLSNKNSVAACVKHFIGYGAAEGGRDYNATFIPERIIREVYLPPFEQAIKAGCASLMTAFNSNNGIPVAGNEFLLKELLSCELGFKGVTVSDWGAISEMIGQGFVEDRESAGEKAINNGVDIDMSSKIYIQFLEKLINEKKVQESTLDSAVYHLLKLKTELNLFQYPYTDINKQKESLSKKHLDIAYKIAQESIVMLKNENETLPLSGDVKKILVVGPLADAPHDQLGTWNMDGELDKTQTPIMSLRKLYGDKVNVEYVKGLNYSRDTDKSKFSEIKKKALDVDVIIVFVGEEAILTGEAHSMSDLNLQGAQSDLVAELSLLGKPLVTVIMAGRPLTIEKEINCSKAVLYAWHPGTMGGPAIADMLFGKTNPEGKLPVTFPKNAGQIPIYYNHYNIGRPATGKEKSISEIPLNAKQSVLGHSSYYLDSGSNPLFPFGFGLSYSQFKIGNLKLSSKNLNKTDTLIVSIDITNTGQYAGSETLQLYTSDLVASVVRPVKELKKFKKVFLKPGEKENVKISLPISSLAFWNSDLKYAVESGKFKVSVGQDSQSGNEEFFSVN